MLEQLAGALGLSRMAGALIRALTPATYQGSAERGASRSAASCFWHHFQPAGSGRELAKQTVDFFVDGFDLDIVEVMPDLPYPFPHNWIQDVGDWRLIEPIDPQRSPWVQQQVTAWMHSWRRAALTTPIVVTMFSPLTEALHFAQSPVQLLEHLPAGNRRWCIRR